MIPIIYNISNNVDNVKLSLNSLLSSNIDDGELIIFDNFNINNSLDDMKLNIIQPVKKITNTVDILKIMIQFGFDMFNNSNHLIILNNDFIFHKHWFSFMKYLFQNEIPEDIAIGSVFNPNPKININNEPFLFNNSITLDAFILSRRLYNRLNSDNMFSKDNFKLLTYDFTSKITSYSYMKIINQPCERFYNGN